MNTSIQNPKPNGIVQPSDDSSQSSPCGIAGTATADAAGKIIPQGEATLSAWRTLPGRFTFAALLAGLLFLLFSAPSARAEFKPNYQSPPGCNGSGLGIFLYTSPGDSHVGCQICYSVTVFNGSLTGPGVCDATNIAGDITTPDGITYTLNLTGHQTLTNGESYFYPNVACYVIRTNDMVSDGLGGVMVRAMARDWADILQNDSNSRSTNVQGVNTEVSMPCMSITAQCTPSVGESGAINFTGTVTNCGNSTLFNITVTDFVNGGYFPVAFITSIPTNSAVSFSGSWVPLNPCSPSTATFTARGGDSFTNCPVPMTASVSTTCSDVLTPGIKVTKACLQPVYPGQPFTFSGSVSNTGNVTLTNIVVVNSQPNPNTPVFNRLTLAPGEVATFSGNYTAPTNCFVTDTLTATAASRCGVGVASIASATCPLLTVPQITVTAACPTAPVLPGGSLTYSVTVRNTGNTILTNVVVTSDRPLPGTTVLTVPLLAPGASTNFAAGPYTVPANVCTVTTTFSGTGQDICALNAATSTVSTICTVTTAPAIAVTLACPTAPAAAGGPITYTGTVSNPGNVTLNNVVVVNSQSGTVLTVPSLTPGASQNFTATFTVPAGACSVSSTVTVSGNDNCTKVLVTNTASATCPLTTTPGIIVTKVCPERSFPGQPLTFSGSVSNSGNVILTNIVVVNNQPVPNTAVITVASLAPGAVTNFTGSYIAPTNCGVADILTAIGQSACGVAVTNTVNATCPITMAPQITVTALCPTTQVLPGGSLTYSVTVQNTGNTTLNNVVVISDRPLPNTPVFSVASLAPGASTSFSAGPYTVPANACTVTTTFSGTGQDVCTLSAVSSTVETTCTVTTSPFIAAMLACSTAPATNGGLITYTGTVCNPGNVTLNNVVVVNSQIGTVLTVPSLTPGACTNFTATFITPADACSVSSTVTVTGSDNCTKVLVTNTASATCLLSSTPGIKVTKLCPPQPVSPGQLLIFSGSVSNTGNVILTNIVVVNSQPSNNTPVITVASLAPGAVTNFTGSYIAPTNCGVADTLTAIGQSICGVAVTNIVSATCPILTTPAIVVHQFCPTTNVVQGGILTYSGTVSNAGNITLTNIIVYNNWPASGTVIFTAASLAPHATTNFTGSYQVPLNCCIAWSTVQATGQGCDGVTVSDTDTGTCTVFTSPSIVVTKVCVPTLNRRGQPVLLLRPGDTLNYSGTVCNNGNITLYNVTVVDNQPINNPLVIGPFILAPGECKPYTGSYTVPPDFCGNDTVTASGYDVCLGILVTNSVTATCPVAPYSPRIVVTKNCPTLPTAHGAQVIYSGTVSNAGNVTLINVFVVDNQPSNNAPVIGPITLAPGAVWNFRGSYTAPLVCCETIDTLTARGQDRCSGSNVTDTATAICPTLYTPGIALVQICPPNLLTMGSVYNFSGFVTNTGDAILTNVVVFGPQGTNLLVPGPIDLAPGESAPYSGSLTVPFNTCAVTITVTSQETCKGTWITNTTSCPILTLPQITVTAACPTAPVLPGGSVAYSVTVQNIGNITLTNVVVISDRPLPSTTLLTVASLAPGASTTIFTDGLYTVPANACTVTTTFTGTGQDICTLRAVTSTVVTTCTVTMAPAIVVTKVCPDARVIPGQQGLTFFGSVSNTGNVTLNNIVVVNSKPVANTPVITIASLAPGAVTNFSFGGYVAPADCSMSDTLTATGLSICNVAVTNTFTATCPIFTTPLLIVTQNCPTPPVGPGSLLTYSGTVCNAGNINLSGIVVTNDQSGSTPLISGVTLAPGECANFTGNYIAPAAGTTTSTSTARGISLCGVWVTNSASSTCSIVTTPGIALTKLCPPRLVAPGETLVFTGTVTNTGNVTLTNVSVVDSLPVPNTPVLGPITLAPGAVISFIGSYIAPLDACSTADTLTGAGNDANTGIRITNTVTALCALYTVPVIHITVDCAQGPVTNGSLVVFGGQVCNTGDISLVNVFVFSGQPSNTLVLGPITLAPGECTNFTGNYLATGGSFPFTNNIIMTNSSVVITTNAPTPVWFGTISTPNGAVVDRFLIGSNFNGLTYAPEDHGYGATEFYSMRKDITTSRFDTIIASTATTTDRFGATPRNFDALTYAAPNLGYGSLLFYYLSHDSAGVSWFGTITPGGAVGVTTDLFAVGTNFDVLTFATTDLGYGANMFYYIRHDANGLSTFGTITPGGTVTDRFTVGTNSIFDGLVFTDLVAPGYGANNFYYLRHGTDGISWFGTIVPNPPSPPTSAVVTDRFPVGTNAYELTYTLDNPAFGANLFYFLRGSGLSLTTNTVTTYTTNGVLMFTPTNIVTAIGQDICLSRTVTASAICSGPTIARASVARGTVATTMVNGGGLSLSFPTETGKSYKVQYTDTLNEPNWIDLVPPGSVPGTGVPLKIDDSSPAALHPSRFYRIISTP